MYLDGFIYSSLSSTFQLSYGVYIKHCEIPLYIVNTSIPATNNRHLWCLMLPLLQQNIQVAFSISVWRL